MERKHRILNHRRKNSQPAIFTTRRKRSHCDSNNSSDLEMCRPNSPFGPIFLMFIIFIHTLFLLFTIVLLIQRSPSHRGIDSDSTNWNQIRPHVIFLIHVHYKTVLILIISTSDLVRCTPIWSDLTE